MMAVHRPATCLHLTCPLPCQVLSNLPLSYPADLWALGCVIFQVGPGSRLALATSMSIMQQLCLRHVKLEAVG